MKAMARIATVVLAAALAGGAARAEEKEGKGEKGRGVEAAPADPRLERLRGLAGEWAGTAEGHGQKGIPTNATIRVVSAGSAVMLVTDPGTPHEMVTMFHGDDGALLATHYCSAMNQPRMRAQPGGDPGKLVFEFTDGTNLGAHPAHMQKLVLSTPAPDRQVQEWTFAEGDKLHTLVFELQRKR